MDTSELQEVSEENSVLEQAAEVEDAFRRGVEELAGDIAASVSPERIKKAIAAALTQTPGEEGSRSLSGDELARSMEQVFAQHLVTDEFAERVSQLAGEVAGELLGAHVEAALKEHESSEAFSGRVRDIASSSVGEMVAEKLTGPELTSRIREVAEAALEERLAGALSEALGSVPDESAIRETASEVVNAALTGDDLDLAVRQIATRVVAENPSPSAEEIARSAAESISATVDEALEEKLAPALDGKLSAALGRYSTSEELAEAITEKVTAGVAPALEALSSAVSSEQLEKTAAELREAQTEAQTAVRQKIDDLDERVTLLSSNLEDAQGVLEEKLAAEISAALEKQEGSEDLEARIREVAGEVAAGLVSEVESKLGELPGSEDVRALSEEVARKVVSETVSERLAELPDAEAVRATAQEVAREVVSEVVSEKLAGLPDEDAIRAMAGEVAGDAVLPIVEEKLKNGLSQQLKSEELSAMVTRAAREVAAELLGARVSKLENDIENKLGREDLEGPAEELRRKTSELSAELEGLRSELGEGASKSLAKAGEQVKSMGESVAAMASFLQDTSLFNQRLNRLDLSLERMAPPEQVNDQIQSLYQDVAAAAEKFQNLPAAEVVKGAARETLESAMKHLQAVEQEQAEKVSEQRLRALIREETGGFDREALSARIDEKIKEVVVEMIRSGDLQDQIKGLVRRSTERKVVPASVKVDSSDVLKELVDSDDFKIALDERFRTMLEYLKMDVMPREVKKILKEHAEG